MKPNRKRKRKFIRRPKLKMKIHHEGRGILFGLLCVLILTNFLVFYFAAPLAFYIVIGLSTVLYLLVANFFRSPVRTNLCEDTLTVFAPADGTIVAIEEVHESEYFKDNRIMVSIFMTVFNVHANWFPIKGEIKHVAHHNGRFMSAYLPKASTENERSMVVVNAENGQDVMARQIAGALARRIVTYAQVGEPCCFNEHMGFIKFGSRVDVYLPIGTEILVKPGQKTVGSQTPIAQLES